MNKMLQTGLFRNLAADCLILVGTASEVHAPALGLNMPFYAAVSTVLKILLTLH
jgi:hypothetical protein